MDTDRKLFDDGFMNDTGQGSAIRVYYSRSLEGSPLLNGCAQLSGLELTPLPADDAERPGGERAIFVVDSIEGARTSKNCAAGFVLSDDGKSQSLPEGWVGLPRECSFEEFFALLSSRWPELAATATLSRLQQEFDVQALVLDQLTEVSLALSSEHNYRRLLDLILSRAMLL